MNIKKHQDRNQQRQKLLPDTKLQEQENGQKAKEMDRHEASLVPLHLSWLSNLHWQEENLSFLTLSF